MDYSFFGYSFFSGILICSMTAFGTTDGGSITWYDPPVIETVTTPPSISSAKKSLIKATGFGEKATVFEGGAKTFCCPVDGNPKPNISWYSEVSETPIFSGEKLKARESGCYTCVASNSLGKPVSIRHCLTVDEYSTTSASPTTASEGVSQTVIGVVVGVAVFVVIMIGLVTWLVCKKKCRKHNKSGELQYAEVDQVNNGESLT